MTGCSCSSCRPQANINSWSQPVPVEVAPTACNAGTTIGSSNNNNSTPPPQPSTGNR